MVDPEKIRMLVEMMSEHELTEISLRDGEEEISLKRPGADQPECGAPMQMSYAPPPMPMAPPAAAPAPGEAAAPAPAEDEDAGLVPVKSPMVGTFYESPNPESPAFVTVGAKISPNTVVCIVEAMKVFNEIKAETSGTIAKVLVKNEDAVEFGQPLFLVKPD